MKLKPEVASSDSAKDVKLTAKDTDITFDNICFEYIEGQKILDGLTFTVPAGKRVAIVGGSGSGKSTIIRLLYRFYEPTTGNIKIGNNPIQDLNLDCLRKHIAIVPQDSVLFHNTIKHNINYGDLKATEEAVINAAKMAEIHHSILVSVIIFFKDKSVYIIVLQFVICCRLGRKDTTPKLENEASNCPVVKNSE